MTYLLILLVFMFISPLIRYVSYYNPLLGMLCYALIIFAFISYSRRRRRAFQQNFYGNASANRANYQQAQASQQEQQNQENKRSSDVIDVEFSEEEVK